MESEVMNDVAESDVVYEPPELVSLGDATVLVEGGAGRNSESVGHWDWE